MHCFCCYYQVGLACVQIAVSKGMKVYGTAGTKEGMDFVLKQGATAVFNHKEEGYADKIVVYSLYNVTYLKLTLNLLDFLNRLPIIILWIRR